MSNQNKRFAFYDMDGTLTHLNLLHSTAYFLANVGEWSGRIINLLSFAGRLPLLYLAEQKDRRQLNITMFASLRGLSRDRLMVLGEEYCDRILMPRLYPLARNLIDSNRKLGLEPVLVTGSPDFLIGPLADRLAIRHFAANRLIFSGGVATGRLEEPVMGGEEKAAWCAEFASEHRADLKECWAYSDSHHDLPFLVCVGHPVAVNPDRKLEATARTRHWPVLRFAVGAATSSPAAETAAEDT